MERKRVFLVLVVLFAALYYAVRVAIFYMSTTGDMQFEEEQSALVEAFVSYSFLAIGVAGLALLPGVYLLRPWGFWGTVAVGAYTVAFDAWALAAVQPSAAAGMVPAAVITAFLLLTRGDYLGKGRPA
ncbi:MAG: hypothetical protein AB1793_02285 [Candidatus Thermoplasmatota archaeon]